MSQGPKRMHRDLLTDGHSLAIMMAFIKVHGSFLIGVLRHSPELEVRRFVKRYLVSQL